MLDWIKGLYDIANHFNEYAGVECNYDRDFPKDAEIEDFLRTYLMSLRTLQLENRAEFALAFGQTEQILDSNGTNGIIGEWVAQVKFLTCLSHFVWSCWSVLQAANSEIDFDFASYAAARYARYRLTKLTLLVV